MQIAQRLVKSSDGCERLLPDERPDSAGFALEELGWLVRSTTLQPRRGAELDRIRRDKGVLGKGNEEPEQLFQCRRFHQVAARDENDVRGAGLPHAQISCGD